ncbi:MAG: CBS domain-containing protein [Actinomycetota bacterium]|nr:CBS domain-containing protein [Actinomycetota bacterium]
MSTHTCDDEADVEPVEAPEADPQGDAQWSRVTIVSMMHGSVVCADPSASVRELAQSMTGEEVGSVVITTSGQVTGIITEHDIVEALANDLDPDTTSAEDVMSPEPFCADVEDSPADVTAKLLAAGVLHAPVLRDGRLVGMISARDLLGGFGPTGS